MRHSYGVECSHPRCSRTTRDLRGRCHDHRGAERAEAPEILLPYLTGTDSRRHTSDTTVHDGTRRIVTRWTRNGLDHRVSGPSMIYSRPDGSPIREYYHRFGKRHRLDGPAKVRYGDGGEVEFEEFYFRGRILGSHALVVAFFVSESERGDPEIAEELIGSAYRVFLDEGHDPDEVFDVLAAGVTTVEGIREVFDGAPLEWVAAFEEGRGD